MEAIMGNHERGKYGPKRIRTGEVGRRPAYRLPTSAEIELTDRIKARFRACREAIGTAPSRACREIENGIQKPLSIPARRAMEMLRAGVPVEKVEDAIANELRAWIREQAARMRYLKPAA